MQTLKKYGKLAVVMHLCQSAIIFGICYVCIRRGVDFKRVLRYFKMNDSDRAQKLGEAGIAFIVYKSLMPVRIGLTVLTVPIAAKLLGMDTEEESETNVFDDKKNQTPSKQL